MIGRSTGDDADLTDLFHILIREAHIRQIRPAILDHGMESVRNSFRLLMDLFDHKMLKTRFFRGFGIPLDLRQLLLDLIAVQIVKSDFPLLEPSDLHVPDVIDIPRVFQDGRDIGGQVGLPVRHAEYQRTLFPRRVDLAGILMEHDRQGVRAADPHHRMVDRVHRRPQIFLVVIVDELDSHLGVCV